jgi:hypothetical protein
MSKLNTLILILLIGSIGLNAQITEKEYRMSDGIQNAILVELPGSSSKKAEGVWKDFTKEFGKVDRNRKQKEFYLYDVIVPAIDHEQTISIATKFEEFDDYTRAYFWMKSGDDYLNSDAYPSQIEGARHFFTDYGYAVEKEVVKDELSYEEKILKDFNKDLEKLEKYEKDLYKDIEKAKETIRKAEEELVKNEQERKEKQAEIFNQGEVVKLVSKKLNEVGKN